MPEVVLNTSHMILYETDVLTDLVSLKKTGKYKSLKSDKFYEKF